MQTRRQVFLTAIGAAGAAIAVATPSTIGRNAVPISSPNIDARGLVRIVANRATMMLANMVGRRDFNRQCLDLTVEPGAGYWADPNHWVQFAHHPAAWTVCPNGPKMLEQEYCDSYVTPSIISIAEYILKHSGGEPITFARTPLPIEGTGAIGTWMEYQQIGLRTIMSYDPHCLGQRFSFDTLFGFENNR